MKPLVLCSTLILSLCVVGVFDAAERAGAAEPSQRHERAEALIRSPSRPPIDGFRSLEWVVDTCELIAIGTIHQSESGNDAELERVLKPIRNPVPEWPSDDAARFAAICKLYQEGDRVLLCWRRDGRGKSWRLYDYFPLFSADDPRRNAGVRYLAVDAKGKAVRDGDDLVARVTERIAAGSRVPPDCDREAVENRDSEYGGFYVYLPLGSELSAAEFPIVLIPPEPEYRDLFLKSISPPPHQGGLPAIRKLANYKDEDVIAGLKGLLGDNLVQEQGFRRPDRTLVHQIYYVWGKKEPGLQPTADIEVRRTFILREAAYESLKKMGVKVERPKLNPE